MSTRSSLGWGGGKEKMHQQQEAPSSSSPSPTYLGEAAEGRETQEGAENSSLGFAGRSETPGELAREAEGARMKK
jgi:hypothetical protein